MPKTAAPAPPIRIIGISGSLREGSYTRKIVEIALEGSRAFGAQTRLIDLREYRMAFYGEFENDEDYPPDVQRFREEVKAADGIILGTPEYHASLSGVIKNALDFMSFEEVEGKMIGLVGVSGGKLGAINALNSLRNIGRNLHAWVLPQQVSVPEAYQQFDEHGVMKNPELRERLLSIGELIAKFSLIHRLQQNDDFIRMWEGLPVNPGGGKPKQ
ncbi:MAG TPA: NADPH-dependent FMN reductase [Calditrichia bacterium]|nr:NADPH-dependent FMN reductase [Calditrichia bacterium]